MKGWECPKCGSTYAPHVTECKRCASDTQIPVNPSPIAPQPYPYTRPMPHEWPFVPRPWWQVPPITITTEGSNLPPLTVIY